MAKKTAIKYSKEAIITSERYRYYYVLKEALFDNKEYTIEDVENILKKFKKEVER